MYVRIRVVAINFFLSFFYVLVGWTPPNQAKKWVCLLISLITCVDHRHVYSLETRRYGRSVNERLVSRLIDLEDPSLQHMNESQTTVYRSTYIPCVMLYAFTWYVAKILQTPL